MTKPKVYCWHHFFDGYYTTISFTTVALSKEDAIDNIMSEAKLHHSYMNGLRELLNVVEPEILSIDQLDKAIVTEVHR